MQDELKRLKETRNDPNEPKEAMVDMLHKRVPKTAAMAKDKPAHEGTSLMSAI